MGCQFAHTLALTVSTDEGLTMCIRLRRLKSSHEERRCCCCLGIAPRAKMLKISAWLLHPKW